MSEKEPNNILFMHGRQILLFPTINVNQHNRIGIIYLFGCRYEVNIAVYWWWCKWCWYS